MTTNTTDRQRSPGAPRVTRPVWLLDVDGVLNASRPGWGGPPRTRTAYAEGLAWRMRYAPALIDRIRAVTGARLAEVRWATTWVPYADQVERAMGLPSLPLAFTAADIEAAGSARAAKEAAARAVVHKERRPLVWTDDDVVPDDEALRAPYQAPGVPALLLRPDGRRGLRPADMDAVEAFLREHAGA